MWCICCDLLLKFGSHACSPSNSNLKYYPYTMLAVRKLEHYNYVLFTFPPLLPESHTPL